MMWLGLEGETPATHREMVSDSVLREDSVEWLHLSWCSPRIAGRKHYAMPPEHSPGKGTLVVAALIVLGIVFTGHWIVSYVHTTDPWAIIPWYGVAALLIVVLGSLYPGPR